MGRVKKRAAPAGGPYELTEEEKDASPEGLFGDPANMEVVDPGERQRIPKAGAWAMITRRLPPIEGSIDEHIRVARVFWIEHEEGADEVGFLPSGRYKVKLNSPWGTLSLWPYEYSRMEPERLIDLWQSGDLVFHPLNIEEAAYNAVVFYARSRGIRLADAAVMALGTLAGPVGWFEPPPDLAKEAEELERELHLPMSEHYKRRMAARARRSA